jgi:hypothetical protein
VNILILVWSLIAVWPGDTNGDGREDLLDYRVCQLAPRLCGVDLGRELATAEGYAYRGDGVRLAVGRPMAVCVVDAAGRTLSTGVVSEGRWSVTYPLDLAVTLELRGEDMRCTEADGAFVCYYDIWVSGDD